MHWHHREAILGRNEQQPCGIWEACSHIGPFVLFTGPEEDLRVRSSQWPGYDSEKVPYNRTETLGDALEERPSTLCHIQVGIC